jgi:hypothetical protein
MLFVGSEKLLESGDNVGKGKCAVSALGGERTSLETGNLKLCGLKKSRTSKKNNRSLQGRYLGYFSRETQHVISYQNMAGSDKQPSLRPGSHVNGC